MHLNILPLDNSYNKIILLKRIRIHAALKSSFYNGSGLIYQATAYSGI
ncbi:hypothetical protein KAX97_06475 [candidate division WOR-3 bacterium]|nr:hypothetical protein [candidate division WOR-3 bacterium]